jgi:hypothetical protein
LAHDIAPQHRDNEAARLLNEARAKRLRAINSWSIAETRVSPKAGTHDLAASL